MRPTATRSALFAPISVALAAVVACGGPGEGPGADPGDGPAALAISLVEPASGVDVLLQAVDAAGPGIVWVGGHEGRFLRSPDGGRTWEPGAGPGGDTLEFRDVAALAPDTALLLASGTGPLSRIYRTEDGGASWTLAFLMDHPEGFLDCMAFWDRDRGVAYGDAVDGVPYVLLTTDGGRSWRRAPRAGLPPAGEGEGGFAASGTCVEVAGDSTAWVATGNGPEARVLKTVDGGRSWRSVPVPVVEGEWAGLTSVRFLGDSVGVAVGGLIVGDTARTRNVAVSRDGGQSWSEGGRLRFAGPAYGAALVPGRPGPLAFAVGPGGIDWSRDGGLTWEGLDDRSWWAAAFAGPDVGWAVGPNGRVVRIELSGGR